MPKKDELSDRQRRFAYEYIKDLNGTRAAIAAGYSAKGAEVRGSELLRIRKVQAFIAELRQEQEKRCQFTADDVLLQLKRTVMFDIRQAFDEEGRLLKPHKLPDDIALVIAGLEVETKYENDGEGRYPDGLIHKFKLPDRVASIANAMKHFGLFKPTNVKVEAGETLRELLEKSLAEDEAQEKAAE